jgi:hypothetical protein
MIKFDQYSDLINSISFKYKGVPDTPIDTYSGANNLSNF